MSDTQTPSVSEAEQADVQAMSFEAAMAALEDVVRSLETGQAPLDQSIALYARGVALKAHCEKLLKAAEARIEKVSLDPAGQPISSVPFEGAE